MPSIFHHNCLQTQLNHLQVSKYFAVIVTHYKISESLNQNQNKNSPFRETDCQIWVYHIKKN